jgi:anti-sigma regulatory factor (Ser/Thr protein kinase)
VPAATNHRQNKTSTASTYRATFAAEPGSVGTARAAVKQRCQQWGFGALCDDAQLIVSELVCNAVRHAGTDIDLTLRARKRGLRMEVTDGSTAQVRRRTSSIFDEGGRGLQLVDALASHHGVRPLPGGKTVWAELDTPAA